MGYKHSYDITNLYQQIRSASSECSNPRNDGFISWGVKQDLYRIKWLLDDCLKSCPDFGDLESEWIREQEKKKVIKILSNDI